MRRVSPCAAVSAGFDTPVGSAPDTSAGAAGFQAATDRGPATAGFGTLVGVAFLPLFKTKSAPAGASSVLISVAGPPGAVATHTAAASASLVAAARGGEVGGGQADVGRVVGAGERTAGDDAGVRGLLADVAVATDVLLPLSMGATVVTAATVAMANGVLGCSSLLDVTAAAARERVRRMKPARIRQGTQREFYPAAVCRKAVARSKLRLAQVART